MDLSEPKVKVQDEEIAEALNTTGIEDIGAHLLLQKKSRAIDGMS